MTGHAMGCREVRDLLDSYLSDELLVETNHAVERHLASCAACAAEHGRRQALRATLREALAVPDEAAVAALEARLTKTLQRRAGWRRLVARRFVPITAAATLVALVGAAWLASRTTVPPTVAPVTGRLITAADVTVYDDMAFSHRFCALERAYPDRPDDDRIADRLGRYAPLVEAAGFTDEGWELVDAHVCPNGDRRLGHYIYRREGRTVSVLVAPNNRGGLPGGEAQARAGDTPLHLLDRAGFALTGIETDGHVAFLVSDFPADAHETLSRRVGPRVAGFLRAQESPLDPR